MIIPFSILHSPLSTLHSPLSILHSPFSILHSPFSILHSILHSIPSVLYSALFNSVPFNFGELPTHHCCRLLGFSQARERPLECLAQVGVAAYNKKRAGVTQPLDKSLAIRNIVIRDWCSPSLDVERVLLWADGRVRSERRSCR